MSQARLAACGLRDLNAIYVSVLGTRAWKHPAPKGQYMSAKPVTIAYT